MSAPKLYYTTTSCGAATYIALAIGGVTFDSETVDLNTGRVASGGDFEAVSWKGSVPSIVLPGGVVLTENVSCLLWAHDNAVKKWGPTAGTPEYYEMVDNLAYVNDAIHKCFGPLFWPSTDEAKVAAKEKLATNLAHCIKFVIKGKKTLGAVFSAADVYMFIVLTWAAFVNVPLPEAATEYMNGIKALDGVGSTYTAINTPKA